MRLGETHPGPSEVAGGAEDALHKPPVRWLKHDAAM
jgi:hypothetical protein